MTGTQPVDFDVIIVGSGPAGVSAAFPLVDAGLRVLMVDGGHGARLVPPTGQYLNVRNQDIGNYDWMIGQNFHALSQADAVSPKLRVPTHAAVFEGFVSANRIVADNFVAVGSLAPGGLSNAWGCGVARMTDKELASFPLKPSEMYTSYAAVAKRIGVSGGYCDDLSDFFGLDEWSHGTVPIDNLQNSMLMRYTRSRSALMQSGFQLGRARVAVLTTPQTQTDRQACNLCGTCLWGCERRALYSATDDLQRLHGRQGFFYRPGFLVEQVESQGNSVAISGVGTDGAGVLRARRVLLAAGTLASTRLALQAINHRKLVAMQSCPTAAFMLWLPRHLGRRHEPAFGLGQLSFTLDLGADIQAFGSLFNTTGIPVSEFARHVPLGKRYGVDLLASLLTSCVVGNLFLPGSLSNVSLQLDEDDQLLIWGGYSAEVEMLMKEARHKLRNSFIKLGALLMPISFKVGRPGTDIHYAASLPMSAKPVLGQTDQFGELMGTAGIHVVDGASLSYLPAKSHTLTIMANAERIATHVATNMVLIDN
ncbi:MAG: hypothetical protein DDT27_00523 [Dehalococcoidia bacterium]|nr:hypothetical protein [Chloroflexota bacterium]MBT9161980.1 hypothetical protein [Chloroflexota bacterium]